MCSEVRAPSDRAQLGFPEAAKTAFAFLQALGFRVQEEQSTLVRFVGDCAFINVYHGRSSYELGVEVGALGAPGSESGYSMSALLRLQAPGEAPTFLNPVATTTNAIRSGLSELALKLKEAGVPEKLRDPSFFEALAADRRRWSASYAAEVLAEQTRPRAEEAFRNGDYAKAVELYEKMRSRLSDTEHRKLEIARRKAGL